MAIPVTLGALTFNATTGDGWYTDGDGAKWRCRRVGGWHLPRSRLTTFDRHGGGSIITHGEHGERPLTLVECFLRATSNAQLMEKLDALAAALNLVSTSGTLTVTEPTTPKQATVYFDRLRDPVYRSDRLVTFEVELLAPDFRKYATSTTAISGAETYVNAGNVATQNIVLAVSAGSTVTNTTEGKAIVTTGTGTLDINILTRTVTKAGVNAYDQIGSATEWFSFLPGNNVVTLSAGTLTGTFRSAWL
jgi:phage-related protein